MATQHPRLKLGKSATFVKTRLKEYPRENETWEADFRALPQPVERSEPQYLGLVVALPKGDPLVYLLVKYNPTVNDLADLFADAIRRPLTGSARRPERIHMRLNPRWEELLPHLQQLGMEVSMHDELPHLEEVYLDFLRQMRQAGSGPIFMLSPPRTDVGKQFPSVGKWVQQNGWIEVGRREEAGFVVRALDDSGLVFENNRGSTLTEAMAALEDALAERLRDDETALK